MVVSKMGCGLMVSLVYKKCVGLKAKLDLAIFASKTYGAPYLEGFALMLEVLSCHKFLSLSCYNINIHLQNTRERER